MKYEIKVSRNRIEGICHLSGYKHPQTVISFSAIKGEWYISESTCLPSNLGRGKEVVECFNAAFKALDNVMRNTEHPQELNMYDLEGRN